VNDRGVIATKGPYFKLMWWKLIFLSVAYQRKGSPLERGEEFKIEVTDVERKAYKLGNCTHVLAGLKDNGKPYVKEV
jgi:hypothetical protein